MNLKTIGIVLLILLCGAVGFLTSGCASTPKNVAKTSEVTHATVKAALSGWNDYLPGAYTRAGTNAASRAQLLDQERKVRAATRQYQAAQDIALSAAQDYIRVLGEPEWDRLSAAAAASLAAGSKVYQLLTQFFPQLQFKGSTESRPTH